MSLPRTGAVADLFVTTPAKRALLRLVLANRPATAALGQDLGRITTADHLSCAGGGGDDYRNHRRAHAAPPNISPCRCRSSAMPEIMTRGPGRNLEKGESVAFDLSTSTSSSGSACTRHRPPAGLLLETRGWLNPDASTRDSRQREFLVRDINRLGTTAAAPGKESLALIARMRIALLTLAAWPDHR